METNYFNEKQNRWLFARLGKITASGYHLLTVGGKRPMTEDELAIEKSVKGRRTTVDTLFGEGAMTYLHTLVDEITTGEPKEEVDFKQTEWGKANEMDAIHCFEEVTGLKVEYHGISEPEFISYGDFAGGSPDGKIITPNVSGICEVKCHYNGANHMKKMLIKSVAEFKDKFWAEYCQDQMNMLVTNTDNCYSISYDPRKKDAKLRLKIIRVPADMDWRTDFHERLPKAIDCMADILDGVYKNTYLF
jgi:hypothetical protein